jgi:hypothetical protein
LARLLKSKNPQDLEQANRIIKNMVKKDEEQTEKVSNRMIELDHINNNVKLLNDMLLNYNEHGLASESEKDTIKFVYEELERRRTNLVKIATETEDDDEAINEILKTNDQCDRIISQYKRIILKEVNGVRNPTHLEDVKLVNLNAGSSHDDSDLYGGKATPASNKLNDSLLLNNSFSSDPLAQKSLEHKATSNYDPLKELQDLFATPNTETSNGVHGSQNDFSEFSYSGVGGMGMGVGGLNANPTSNIENLLSSISINSNQQQQQLKPMLTPTNLNPSIQDKVQNVKPKNQIESSSEFISI